MGPIVQGKGTNTWGMGNKQEGLETLGCLQGVTVSSAGDTSVGLLGQEDPGGSGQAQG